MLHKCQRGEAGQHRRTSTRAPLLMLRGVLRVDCMVMRPLDALSTPLAVAKLLGIAEALALVLTPADSLCRRPASVTCLNQHSATCRMQRAAQNAQK